MRATNLREGTMFYSHLSLHKMQPTKEDAYLQLDLRGGVKSIREMTTRGGDLHISKGLATTFPLTEEKCL